MKGTLLLITRNGMGDAPAELQQLVLFNFLNNLVEKGSYPESICMYAEGVKTSCAPENIVELFGTLSKAGVKIIVCQTCLNYFKLTEQVKVGTIGAIGQIIEEMSKAQKVISL